MWRVGKRAALRLVVTSTYDEGPSLGAIGLRCIGYFYGRAPIGVGLRALLVASGAQPDFPAPFAEVQLGITHSCQAAVPHGYHSV